MRPDESASPRSKGEASTHEEDKWETQRGEGLREKSTLGVHGVVGDGTVRKARYVKRGDLVGGKRAGQESEPS